MSDREEMLALADEYERSLNRMRGSCYQEYQGSIRRHELVIKALRSTARTGPAVAVKPLEWTDHSFDGSIFWIARTSFDDYRITKENAEWPYVVRPHRTQQSNYQTLEEAKADCEADYEQRIRSAITATVGTAEPGYQAGFEACRAFVAAVGQSLDDDFGFWSSPTSDVVRSKLYSLWAKANAQAALPAPAGKEVTAEELASLINDHIEYGYERATDQCLKIIGFEDAASALLSTFTITRKSGERS